MRTSTTSASHLVSAWRYVFRGLLVILGVLTIFNVFRDLRFVVAGLLVAMVLAEIGRALLDKRRGASR
jgi:hypothetical protein